MIAVLTALVAAPLTNAVASLSLSRNDRRWMSVLMLGAWVCLLPLLAITDVYFPFASGGDDQSYFDLAAVEFRSLADALDLTRFDGAMEQPGYPWLLSIIYQFTGPDRLALKALNLGCFLLLVPVWFRIGNELGPKEFARRLAVAVVCLTPLWFYWMFLLKDIVVALLQSIFLLGLVRISSGRGKGAWSILFISTLALLLFRAQAVLINLAVLVVTIGLMFIRRGYWSRSVVALAVSVVVSSLILSVATDPERMAALGIFAEHRVLNPDAMRLSLPTPEQSLMRWAQFPLLYLFIETSGFSPQTWVEFSAADLRGLLAIPWILFGVPFFIAGLRHVFRSVSQPAATNGSWIRRLQTSWVVSTPWGAIVCFVGAYTVVAWLVADTTRYRLSDIPAMAALSLVGFSSMPKAARTRKLVFWVLGVGAAFTALHLVRAL